MTPHPAAATGEVDPVWLFALRLRLIALDDGVPLADIAAMCDLPVELLQQWLDYSAVAWSTASAVLATTTLRPAMPDTALIRVLSNMLATELMARANARRIK